MLISTQHQDGVDRDTVIRPDLIDQVIRPTIPAQFADDDFTVWINPTGTFVLGGPHADCGLTGRKIIVDTYGGMGRHGGGAFSGKDPSKVDRSAAYAARWVAKHVVASGAATRCEVQVAYAIGIAHPMSILVDTFGTNTVDRGGIEQAVRDVFDLRPGGHRARPRPQAADLPRHRRLRPLRSPAARLHVGAHQPPRRLQGSPRRLSAPAPRGARIARVLPDVTGLDKEFDYVVPEELVLDVHLGSRVRVPLHGRRVGGWVVALDPPDRSLRRSTGCGRSPRSARVVRTAG